MRASKLQEWPAMMDQNQNPEDEHSEGGVLPGVRDGTAGVPGIVNTHRATHGREPSNSPSATFFFFFKSNSYSHRVNMFLVTILMVFAV